MTYQVTCYATNNWVWLAPVAFALGYLLASIVAIWIYTRKGS